MIEAYGSIAISNLARNFILARFVKTVGVLFCVAVLAACDVSLAPLTEKEISERVAADKLALAHLKKIDSKALTLEAALERSLIYGLDAEILRVRAEAGRFRYKTVKEQFLPELAANDNTSGRSNQPGSIGGVEESRYENTQEYRVSWSTLSLGLGYLRSRSAGNQFLAELENSRDSVNTIVLGTVESFARVQEGDRLRKTAVRLLAKSRAMRRELVSLGASNLSDPFEAARLEGQLLSLEDVFTNYLHDLTKSEVDLAVKVVAPKNKINLVPMNIDRIIEDLGKPLQMDLAGLEEYALRNRAELRVSDYKSRSLRDEAWGDYLALFPLVSLTGRHSRSDDENLLNPSWNRFDLRIAFNAISLLQYPNKRKLSEAEISLEDARRLATSVSIMSQVRLARAEVEFQKQARARSRERVATTRRIANVLRNRTAFKPLDKFTKLEAELQLLVSELTAQRDRLALLGAYLRFYRSLGVDLVSLEDVRTKLKQDSAGNLKVVNRLRSAGSEVVSSIRSYDKTVTN